VRERPWPEVEQDQQFHDAASMYAASLVESSPQSLLLATLANSFIPSSGMDTRYTTETQQQVDAMRMALEYYGVHVTIYTDGRALGGNAVVTLRNRDVDVPEPSAAVEPSDPPPEVDVEQFMRDAAAGVRRMIGTSPGQTVHLQSLLQRFDVPGDAPTRHDQMPSRERVDAVSNKLAQAGVFTDIGEPGAITEPTMLVRLTTTPVNRPPEMPTSTPPPAWTVTPNRAERPAWGSEAGRWKRAEVIFVLWVVAAIALVVAAAMGEGDVVVGIFAPALIVSVFLWPGRT
jgi:hypothetical protein